MAKISMCRPGKTICTAMFAATIGIDGPVEADIGRFVIGDDGAAFILVQPCGKGCLADANL